MANLAYYDSGNLAYKQIGTPQAQTFVVPTGYNRVDWVKLKLRKVGSPTGDATCSIYTLDGDGKPSVNLGTATYPNASVGGSGTYDWYTFSFGTPIAVTAGTYYAVVFTSTTDTSNTVMWFGDGSWSGGVGWRMSSGVWGVVSWDYSINVDGSYVVTNYIPTVTTTSPATSILNTSFAIAGNVTSDGSSTITERGFCYMAGSGTPTTANFKATVSGTTGAYSTTIGSLTATTLYSVRAYAINGVGTGYGSTVEVTTISDPAVTTGSVSSITITSFDIAGNVTSSGGGTISARGFVYSSENATPTLTDSKIIVSGTTGAYSGTISGLIGNTTYYVRAYVTTEVSTVYGSVVSTTTSTAPNTVLAELYSSTDNNLNDANVKIYTEADDEWHHMVIQNKVLYIADRNYVHQVEDVSGGHYFSGFVLDIPRPQKITALSKFKTDLLIGSKIADTVNEGGFYVWNTWSESFTIQDELKETGINAFIEGDNYVLASAGTNGNLYVYSNGQMELYKTIPGDYSPTKTCTINPYATANFKNLPLFGVSNVEGNPLLQGVYSYGSKAAGFPFVLNLEFPISQRDGDDFLLSNVEIGAIVVSGNNIYVSWRDGADNVGIDKLDWNNKLDGAYFETKLINPDRSILGKYNKYVVAYKSLPDDTSINLAYQKNHATLWSTVTSVTDTIRGIVYKELEVEATSFRVRVKLGTDGNNAPEIETAYVFLE